MANTIYAIGFSQVGFTAFGLVGGASFDGLKGVENSLRITTGLFYLDENKSFFGGIWEGISRFSYEIIQSYVGYGSAQITNGLGYLSRVDYLGGATFSTGNFSGSSVSLGNNILLDASDPDATFDFISNDGYQAYTTMHEYGHYMQSKRNGFAYLFKYGLPSLGGSVWTEEDANLRASKYFSKHYGVTWDHNRYTGNLARYSNLPSSGTESNTRWYEWPVFPLTFIWN